MAKLEEINKGMFHVTFPELDEKIIEALDSNNKSKLHAIIKVLDCMIEDVV